jgi:hypothetical protein
MSILISPTLANETSSYYALAGAGGGGGGVSSLTNGGQINCGSGTGDVTLTNAGVNTLSLGATPNGLAINSSVGSITVSYTAPTGQQPLVSANIAPEFPAATTLAPGATLYLYDFYTQGGGPSDPAMNVIQYVLGIYKAAQPFFAYTSTTGLPNLVIWVGPFGLTALPSNPSAGSYISLIDDANTGAILIPRNMSFMSHATGYTTGGKTSHWALYLTNGSSGDVTFAISGVGVATEWDASCFASLATVV